MDNFNEDFENWVDGLVGHIIALEEQPLKEIYKSFGLVFPRCAEDAMGALEDSSWNLGHRLVSTSDEDGVIFSGTSKPPIPPVVSEKHDYVVTLEIEIPGHSHFEVETTFGVTQSPLEALARALIVKLWTQSDIGKRYLAKAPPEDSGLN